MYMCVSVFLRICVSGTVWLWCVAGSLWVRARVCVCVCVCVSVCLCVCVFAYMCQRHCVMCRWVSVGA